MMLNSKLPSDMVRSVCITVF